MHRPSHMRSPTGRMRVPKQPELPHPQKDSLLQHSKSSAPIINCPSNKVFEVIRHAAEQRRQMLKPPTIEGHHTQTNASICSLTQRQLGSQRNIVQRKTRMSQMDPVGHARDLAAPKVSSIHDQKHWEQSDPSIKSKQGSQQNQRKLRLFELLKSSDAEEIGLKMHESQKRRKERIPRVTVNQERMSIDLFAEPLSAKLPGFMCREMPVWKYPRNVYTELIDKIEVKYEKPVKHEIGKYRDEVRYHMKYSTPRFKGRQNSRDEIGFDSRLQGKGNPKNERDSPAKANLSSNFKYEAKELDPLQTKSTLMTFSSTSCLRNEQFFDLELSRGEGERVQLMQVLDFEVTSCESSSLQTRQQSDSRRRKEDEFETQLKQELQNLLEDEGEDEEADNEIKKAVCELESLLGQ